MTKSAELRQFTNYITVDENNNRVGVHTSSPELPLHVKGSNQPLMVEGTGGGAWIDYQGVSGDLFSAGRMNESGWAVYNRTTNSYLVKVERDGRLGIGTPNPAHKLHITGSGDTNRVHVTSTSYTNSAGRLGANSLGGFVDLWDQATGANTFKMRSYPSDGVQGYFTAGNIGVGTSNPTAKLHIYSTTDNNTLLKLQHHYADIDSSGTLGQGNFIEFSLTDNNATFTPQVRIGMVPGDADNVDAGIPSEGNGNFVVQTAEGTDTLGNGILVERFRVNEKGHVGIGTSNPDTQLTVTATDNSGARTAPIDVLSIVADNPSSPYDGFGGRLVFKNRRYASDVIDTAATISAIKNDLSVSTAGSDLVFSTGANTGDAMSDRMIIRYNGNVGIGETSPLTKLHVKKTGVTHYTDGYTTALIEDTEARLQIAAQNGGSNAAALLLSNENHHWVMHHRGPGAGNTLILGYVDTTNTSDLVDHAMGAENQSLILNKHTSLISGSVQIPQSNTLVQSVTHRKIIYRNAGSSAANGVRIARVRKHYWGHGVLKIEIQRTYYSGYAYGEYICDCHTRHSHSPYTAIRTVTDMGAPAPYWGSIVDVGAEEGYVDLFIDIPSYFGYAIKIEASNFGQVAQSDNLHASGINANSVYIPD